MRINIIRLVSFSVPLVLLMICASCRKTGYTIVSTTADSSAQIITAGDELNINYELDQAINEALLATTVSEIASGDTGNGTGTALYTTISQVIIDTSRIIDSSLIRLTYYGKNADQTKGRSGMLTLQYASDDSGRIIPWKTPGSTIRINFEQYEVIVLATNKSLWMNGTVYINNISGGLLKKPADISLTAGDTLKDKVTGSIAFTYNDNTTNIQTWTWFVNQMRTFTLQNEILTSAITGDSTLFGLTDISTSGTTRFGKTFYTEIISPVTQTISSLYLLSNPACGEKAIHGIPEPLTIDYGVDSHGNAVLENPYGYKLSWISNGGQATSVVAY